MRRFVLVLSLCTLGTFTMAAQDATQVDVTPMAQTPVYRINVVSRSVQAVNYRHRNGSTKIDFRGTSLMPDGSGFAKVDSKGGGPRSMQSSRTYAMRTTMGRNI